MPDSAGFAILATVIWVLGWTLGFLSGRLYSHVLAVEKSVKRMSVAVEDAEKKCGQQS